MSTPTDRVARDDVARPDGVAGASSRSTPTMLPTAAARGVGADEVALRPLPVAFRPTTWTPMRLPEMTLPARRSSRRSCSMEIPLIWRSARRSGVARTAAVPAASVPMKLPWTTVARRAGADDLDAARRVARDDVAGRRAAVPPMVLPRRRSMQHAVAGCPAAAVPAASVPMKLPCDQVARGAAAGDDPTPSSSVARDDVAAPRRPSRRSCCRRRRRGARRRAVAQGGGAGGVGADEVALDQVARRRRRR